MEDAIVVTEKAGRAIKPKTIHSCCRKLCPDARGQISNRANPVIVTVGVAKGGGWGERLQDRDLGETEVRTDVTPGKITEDEVKEMSASKPVLDQEEADVEEAMLENKLALANPAQGS